MPYTHRKVGNKECVFKKDTGKKVGCTTGDINDYLGALHANVKTEEQELEEGIINIGREKMYNGLVGIKDSLKNESVRTSQMFKTIINSIKTGKQLTSEERIKLGEDLKNLLTKLGYGAVFMLPGGSVFILTYKLIKNRMSKNKEKLTEVNKLKGGKSDNMTIKDIANNFNVPVSDIKKQINKGEKVESEHTTDKEKQTEIATDHVSEFPDYYDRLDKMEKAAEKAWGKKEKKKKETNESKIFIKKLLRENIQNSSINQQISNELKKLGVTPNDAYIIIDNDMQTEGLGETIKKTYDKFKTYSQAIAKPLIVCSVLAGVVSCQKNNPYVYKFSYHIDKKIDYTLKQDAVVGNNLKLDAGQKFGIMGGIVYMNNSKLPQDLQQTMFDFINNNKDLFTNNSQQQYKPQEQVGSWYELEDHKLPEEERESMEEQLAANEKTRLTGKDYIITDYKFELVGQSKHGDIETTDGYK